jgi:predicted nucleotidyltransferase
MGSCGLAIEGESKLLQPFHNVPVPVSGQLDPLTPYALVHLKQELEDLMQCSVDLVRLRDRMAPTLRKRIEQEGLTA